MCRIYFIQNIKNKRIDKNLFNDVLSVMKEEALMNRDGYGAFNEHKEYIKRPDRLTENNIHTLKQFQKNSSTFIGHIRLSTGSKVNKKNTHPYHLNNELLVHNGMFFNNDIKSKKSDTLNYFLEYSNSNKTTTTDKIKDVMSNTIGTYSIFHFDKNNRLFYYRNKENFTFGLINNHLIGMTSEYYLNKLMVKYEGDILLTATPTNKTIYEIKNYIKKVDKIKQKSIIEEYKTKKYQPYNTLDYLVEYDYNYSFSLNSFKNYNGGD